MKLWIRNHSAQPFRLRLNLLSSMTTMPEEMRSLRQRLPYHAAWIFARGMGTNTTNTNSHQALRPLAWAVMIGLSTMSAHI
ncbi:hypothetical protein CKAH01_17614 [Colletotrichum kahawae]|uniref:Uncharacterized protein n=1 Tax=Colletotrichum kahawae TaxID=34407 RepID=A0AAD9Y9U4_COLKA|nr:hypothetical protein CKAH01_17614 [Colletotrichum kahawae]